MDKNREIAAAAFEPLLAAATAKGDARAMLLLADQAFRNDLGQRAMEIIDAVVALAGNDPEIATRAQDIVGKSIPSYHVEMVRDLSRNQAFEAALQRAVTAQTRVLDVGTGTGLLAMMAARAGARQVYACEQGAAMARVARDNVLSNGLADQVRVINKHSGAIDVDGDLGGQVDLVVAEIIGKDLVDESVLPSMRDVAARLLKPGGQVIPRAGHIQVALAWWEGLNDQVMQRESGFDLSAFNRLLRPYHSLRVGDAQLEIRGEQAALYSFDFCDTAAGPVGKELDLVARGGPVNGVVQWLRLQMDDLGFYENRPAPGASSHWACMFFPLREPLDARPGDRVHIAATHALDRLLLWQSAG